MEDPKKIIELYHDGFEGCIIDEEDIEAFRKEDQHVRFGDTPAYTASKAKDLKKVYLYKSAQKFDPTFGAHEAQKTGDCHRGDTLVTTPNGKKRIDEISIGDLVVTPKGNVKRVIDVIKKSYKGLIYHIGINRKNINLHCTPDHKIMVFSNSDGTVTLKPARELCIGDMASIALTSYPTMQKDLTVDLTKLCESYNYEYVVGETDTKRKRLVPVKNGHIRVKNGSTSCKRYISIDNDLAWLIGLYAAEGSSKKHSIIFNLGRHENSLIQRTVNAIRRVFEVEPSIYSVPSKPNVQYVEINCTPATLLFRSMCGGNTYTKTIHHMLYSTVNSDIQLSLLHGWLDGDGYYNSRSGTIGTTVSGQLIHNILDISHNVGLNPRLSYSLPRTDKNGVKHRLAYRLRFGNSVQLDRKNGQLKINPEKIKNVYNLSVGVEIDTIETYDYHGYVYCINVEDDHLFIANGIGTANCVSHGHRNALDVTRAVEIDVKGEPEAWVARGATENIYQARTHGGAGMSPSVAARYVSKTGGLLLRKDYGEVDLSKYNPSLGIYKRIPRSIFINEAHKHPVTKVASIDSLEELKEAFANGYACTISSNWGFGSRRDKYGKAKPSGSWNHCYLEDTIILGNKIKRICDVNIGDNVIGHDGKLHHVAHTFKRYYNGEILKIKSLYLPTTHITPEHPILVARKRKYAIIGRSDSNFEVDWIQAKELRVGDYLCIQRNNPYEEKYEPVVFDYQNKRRKPISTINPSSDLAWLFGLYIADGNSVKHHRICFTINIKELHIVNRIVDVVKKCFGLKTYIKQHNTFYRVYVYSSVLADNFRSWFGGGYNTPKKVPQFIMHWHKFYTDFIKGIVDGDGHVRNNGVVIISNTSTDVIYNCRQILLHMGMRPSLKRKVNKGTYQIKNKEQYIWTLGWTPNYQTDVQTKNEIESFMLCKITGIELIGYSGHVYNLEVDDVNSYIADGYCTHNCMQTCAYDDDIEGILIVNSWGAWNSGPKHAGQPDGSFWVDYSIMERWIRDATIYAYSQFEGFPVRQLPDYGLGEWL